MKIGKKALPALAAASLTAILAAGAVAHAAPKQTASVPDNVITKIRSWASDPVVIDAIRAQNRKNATLTQTDIDKLDKKWRAETKASAHPLIDSVMSNELSAYLSKIKQNAGGLYTEIFVMDDRGLNVGQSDVTSDYWQGDEAKWQKTYPVGPAAVFKDKVEFDESSQTYEAQVSISISDPDTGKPIGAVTVGVDADQL